MDYSFEILIQQKLDIIKKYLESLNVDMSLIEVELRFGNFIRNKFVPGIDRTNFMKFKKFLDTKYRRIYTYTEDKVYKSSKIKERYTTEYNNEGIVQRKYRTVKEQLKKEDIPDYWLRIAISQEITDEQPEPLGFDPISIRKKRRWSYPIVLANSKFQVDLTEVDSTYEVEIEVLPPQIINIKELGKISKLLLLKILDSNIIYSKTEKSKVIENTNYYLGIDHSSSYVSPNILIQPRNLKIRDLTIGGIIPNPEDIE